MTIKELYLGNNIPIEMRYTSDSEYVRLSAEWVKLYDEFIAGLSEKQREDFDRLTDIHGDQNCISNERCYTQGFRDGAELMLEILRDESE